MTTTDLKALALDLAACDPEVDEIAYNLALGRYRRALTHPETILALTARVEALEELIAGAYAEGYSDSAFDWKRNRFSPAKGWLESDARAALNAKDVTP